MVNVKVVVVELITIIMIVMRCYKSQVSYILRVRSQVEEPGVI